VAGKAYERHANYSRALFDKQAVPMPLATSMRRVFWRPHPSTVIAWPDRQEIQQYNPRPKPVYAHRLTDLLLGLPKVEHAKSLVASCRLYALALELIHDRPDISYQLLISSVETVANGVLRAFQPDDDLKVEHHKAVYDLALSLSLGEETARRLAIEACRREWWATKKFKAFLIDNAAESIWTEKDELFHQMPAEVMPKRENFERTLSRIYAARSKATHAGQPFPIAASYTGGPNISMRAGHMLFGTDSPFPPVVWFERVVNSALCSYWERSIPAPPAAITVPAPVKPPAGTTPPPEQTPSVIPPPAPPPAPTVATPPAPEQPPTVTASPALVQPPDAITPQPTPEQLPAVTAPPAPAATDADVENPSIPPRNKPETA
jgi:hypothetical protein